MLEEIASCACLATSSHPYAPCARTALSRSFPIAAGRAGYGLLVRVTKYLTIHDGGGDCPTAPHALPPSPPTQLHTARNHLRPTAPPQRPRWLPLSRWRPQPQLRRPPRAPEQPRSSMAAGWCPTAPGVTPAGTHVILAGATTTEAAPTDAAAPATAATTVTFAVPFLRVTPDSLARRGHKDAATGPHRTYNRSGAHHYRCSLHLGRIFFRVCHFLAGLTCRPAPTMLNGHSPFCCRRVRLYCAVMSDVTPSKRRLQCLIEGCTFSSLSFSGLTWHGMKVHGEPPRKKARGDSSLPPGRCSAADGRSSANAKMAPRGEMSHEESAVRDGAGGQQASGAAAPRDPFQAKVEMLRQYNSILDHSFPSDKRRNSKTHQSRPVE